jgi:hypothetical protein
MKWTIDTEKALQQVAIGSKNATKKLYKKWIGYLNKLTGMTRVKLHVIDRNKVVIKNHYFICDLKLINDLYKSWNNF